MKIYGDLGNIPMKVKRKIGNNTTGKRDYRNTGINVEFDKIDEYYGFEIDGDHLFLLEDMTVTHNTFSLHRLKDDFLNNGGEDVRMLMYNWEIPWLVVMLTQLKKALNKSYFDILNKPREEHEIPIYKKVASAYRDDRLTVVQEALTPLEWKEVTESYIKDNLNARLILVANDHLGILKGDDKRKVVYQMMEYQNELKLKYSDKVMFINLSQLNREMDKIWRNPATNPINLRVGSDMLLHGDAMQQYSDVILTQCIPERVNLDLFAAINIDKNEHLMKHYVPEKKRLKGSNRVYYDYLKTRMPEVGNPTLFCEIMNKDLEEKIEATLQYSVDPQPTEEEDDYEF